MAEKYYSFSPYVYCANNPVIFVDPDGKRIAIRSKDGDNLEVAYYTPGAVYKGENEFIKKMFDYLNAIYFGGGSVVDLLHYSNRLYTLVNELPNVYSLSKQSINAFRYVPIGRGLGGQILAGLSMSDPGYVFRDIESISHELFHAVQDEFFSNYTRVFNEVEANVFGVRTAMNWYDAIGRKMGIDLGFSEAMNGQNQSQISRRYMKSMADMIESGFSWESFNTAVETFKKGSGINSSGVYNKYKSGTTDSQGHALPSLLQQFYPESIQP